MRSHVVRPITSGFACARDSLEAIVPLAAMATLFGVAAVPAHAATSGFPPVGDIFTIRTDVPGRGQECLTRIIPEHPKASKLRFRPCDSSNPRQRFVQFPLNGNGAGMIRTADRQRILTPLGSALGVFVPSAKTAWFYSWKQNADGTITHGSNTLPWRVSRMTDGEGLNTTDKTPAARFAIVPV